MCVPGAAVTAPVTPVVAAIPVVAAAPVVATTPVVEASPVVLGNPAERRIDYSRVVKR